MRKVLAWLGVATLFVLTSSSARAEDDVLKPYVVMILDTSGSMLDTTNAGPTSCGRSDNRINHAVCAINNIVNSYGDMVLSLGRFVERTNGTVSTSCDANGDQFGNPGFNASLRPINLNPSAGDQCSTQGPFCGDCEPSSGLGRPCSINANCFSNNCAPNGRCASPVGANSVLQTTSCTTADDAFEVLTPLVEGNNSSTALLTNGSCTSCSINAGSDPEIWGVSPYTWTPLAAVLNGSKRYWQGEQATNGSVIWPSNQPGFDPINRDPNAAVFLPKAGQTKCNPKPNCDSATSCTGDDCCCVSQCRPYVTILLTDGDESCTAFSNTTAAAASLLSTTPRNDAVNIVSASRTGGVVTITTGVVAHPFRAGDEVIVDNVTNATFNGTFTIASVPSSTSVTITQTGTNSSSGGGTIAHSASAYKYRILVKPIGFGKSPGDAEIEAIAHAGGAVDLPGVFEGYYAQNESDLELAISQILADSVRAESCNNLDDDCDTRIDEDFPNKGGTCTKGVGNCFATGELVCSGDGTGLVCNAPDIAPGNEGTVCNQQDDDCDGLVDEGLNCTSCVPIGELCNNKDDDCDGKIDEGLTRSCGQGACTGEETCTNGAWTGCDAQPVENEICDGKDNDCDGVCDGIQLGCSEVNGACTNATTSCPETNSPGHPGHYNQPDAGETVCNDAIDNDLDGLINDGCPAVGTAETVCNDALDNDNDGFINDGCPVPLLPIAQNVCQPGVRVCPQLCSANGNSFSLCSGEVKPAADDPCNGLDDDCDNKIDEGFVPADCSTNCGVGQTSCVNGQLVCNSTPQGDDTTCNNVDDDCDNKIDEDWKCDDPNSSPPAACACGGDDVCDGEAKCINGQIVCQGGPVGTETCNCEDDDCDGKIDENPEGNLCPGGATCVNCQCAFGCAEGEFPCPLGKKCENTYCVNDPCYMHTCPPVNGNAQVCIPKPGNENEPQCISACEGKTCPTNFVCYGPTGECRPDDCTTFPERCTANQACIVGDSGFGTCVTNPCAGVMCAADKYCIGGTCVPSCADVTCPTGQRCRQGVCELDPCGKPCPFGYACNDVSGECIADPCKNRMCPQGKWCNPNDGQCEDDPCVINAIECPNDGEECRGGTCLDPESLRPDAAGAQHVTVGGGGGCNTTGGSSTILLAGLALAWMRRRRRVRVVRDGGVQ